MISFPDAAAFNEWSQSPAYQQISKDGAPGPIRWCCKVGVAERHLKQALPPALTSFCSPDTFLTPTLMELAYDQLVTDATFEEMLGIVDVPGARSVRFLPHKRYLGGRTSPVFVRLYHKVEHDLQLTRLEVVLRKPRLQALGIRDLDDLFRLDPHVLINYVLHSRVQPAQLEGLLHHLQMDWQACPQSAGARTTGSPAIPHAHATMNTTAAAKMPVVWPTSSPAPARPQTSARLVLMPEPAPDDSAISERGSVMAPLEVEQRHFSPL